MPDNSDRTGEGGVPGCENRAKAPRTPPHTPRRRRWLALLGLVSLAATLAACGGDGHRSRKPLSAATSRSLQAVPMDVLTAAGAKVTELTPAVPLSAPALTSAGKPQILYLGGEFCPYCAAERWPLVVALSKFGSFAGLQQTTTGPEEGDLPTISFYGSTYTSSHVTFTPVELYGNQRQGESFQPLETPSADQRALWTSTLQGHLTFPFVDIGGRYLLKTSQFAPTLLKGLSFQAIAGSVGDNATTVGANVDAAASVLVGYICSLTGDQPTTTCRAPGRAG